MNVWFCIVCTDFIFNWYIHFASGVQMKLVPYPPLFADCEKVKHWYIPVVSAPTKYNIVIFTYTISITEQIILGC